MTGVSETKDILLGWLGARRRHVLGTFDDLSEADRHTSRVPSGWTPVGAVQHLALDVERFWFAGVLGGRPDGIAHGYEGWTVAAGTPSEDVLELYRAEAERSDELARSLPLDAAPVWWPDGDPADAPFPTLEQILVHVLVETSIHAGHLDVVRELADDRQRLVLDQPD